MIRAYRTLTEYTADTAFILMVSYDRTWRAGAVTNSSSQNVSPCVRPFATVCNIVVK